MGGCYRDDDSWSTQRLVSLETWQKELRAWSQTFDTERLTAAYRSLLTTRQTARGFITQLAEQVGIKDIANIPKELPEIEYEVKFDISVQSGRGKEPSLEKILDAFDFTPAINARFLKDPAHMVATGINRFYGTDTEERLVVIEKAGNLYLKEKSAPVEFDAGVSLQELVVKRSENRYQSNTQEVLDKVAKVSEEPEVSYKGRIRKEKADDFILDTYDGRIYSFTITRAHLMEPGATKESRVQRQLEIEYAGYIPSFPDFRRNSEKQIIGGLVTLAKYIGMLYGNSPIGNGWSMNLRPTTERKFDFVAGRTSLETKPSQQLSLPV